MLDFCNADCTHVHSNLYWGKGLNFHLSHSSSDSRLRSHMVDIYVSKIKHSGCIHARTILSSLSKCLLFSLNVLTCIVCIQHRAVFSCLLGPQQDNCSEFHIFSPSPSKPCLGCVARVCHLAKFPFAPSHSHSTMQTHTKTKVRFQKVETGNFCGQYCATQLGCEFCRLACLPISNVPPEREPPSSP